VKASTNRSEARRPPKVKAGVRARPAAAKPAPVKKASAKPAPDKKPVADKGLKAVAKPAPKVAAPKPIVASAKAAKLVEKAVAQKSVAKSLVSKASAALVAPQSGKTAKAAKPVAPALVPSSPPPAKKPARKSIKEAAGVSTDAVARRTGKTWDDWFEVLDSAGAAMLDQRGVIAILAQKHGIGPWWQQMIAVGYESLRAKSDKPPAVDGFHINSSCTLDAPLPRVFRLWNDAGERARWLADDRFVVRGATADKVIRARWGKGTSHVAVSFAEKSGRTEVSVEHHQIESRGAAEQMKAYWAKKLGLLDQALAPRR
jgi:hypothetical protein